MELPVKLGLLDPGRPTSAGVFLFTDARRFPNYQRGQRRIDVLELLRIVEALKGNPKRVFANRTERMSRE